MGKLIFVNRKVSGNAMGFLALFSTPERPPVCTYTYKKNGIADKEQLLALTTHCGDDEPTPALSYASFSGKGRSGDRPRNDPNFGISHANTHTD